MAVVASVDALGLLTYDEMRDQCRPLTVALEFYVLVVLLASTIALLVIGLRRSRESLAFGALAAACAVVLLAIAVFILTFPGGHRPSMTTACIVNLSNLSKALQMYEGDNDGMTPPGRWVETFQGYYTDYAELKCPVYDSLIGYALNTQMEDVDSDLILNPVKTVAFFDAISSAGNTGVEEAIAWRHTDERAVFSFADGHCRPYKREERPSFEVVLSKGE